MDATTHPHETPETHHHDEHGHEHHELGFWRKYVFSTDHKVIGIQYGISGLLFLFFGFCLMMVIFFVPGGAAKVGWTSYTPLGVIADTGPNFHPFFNGQTLWLVGFIFLISSSLLGAINFITTIIQLRAPGLTWMRLPFFVWAQFVTAFLLLLAFPPLEAAVVMQTMDRLASTSFFLPCGLVVNGAALQVSGGGSPLLWQHLFWFLGHPEVYVLI